MVEQLCNNTGVASKMSYTASRPTLPDHLYLQATLAFEIIFTKGNGQFARFSQTHSNWPKPLCLAIAAFGEMTGSAPSLISSLSSNLHLSQFALSYRFRYHTVRTLLTAFSGQLFTGHHYSHSSRSLLGRFTNGVFGLICMDTNFLSDDRNPNFDSSCRRS
jgi:hypothetical protein